MCLQGCRDVSAGMQGCVCRDAGMCLQGCRDVSAGMQGYVCRDAGMCLQGCRDLSARMVRCVLLFYPLLTNTQEEKKKGRKITEILSKCELNNGFSEGFNFIVIN